MDLSYFFISIALFHFGSYASKFDDEYSNALDTSHCAYSESKDLTCYCSKCENTIIPSNYTYKEGLGYYKYNESKVAWNTARKFCESEGAHLAIPDNEEELNHLLSIKGEDQTWLGIHDYFQKKDWVTILDKKVNYTKWYDGEPGHFDTQFCLVLWKGAMHSAVCTKATIADIVCEISCLK